MSRGGPRRLERALEDLSTGFARWRLAAAFAALVASLGVLLSLAGMPKVGRNDPCPCGSGKKFKQCHGGPNQ